MHSMRAAEVAAAAQLARDLSAVVAGAAPIPHLPFSSVAPAANPAAVPGRSGRPTRPRRWPEGLRLMGFEMRQMSFPSWHRRWAKLSLWPMVLPSDGSRKSEFM
eukprot:CAMPEP_0198686744 /NCGR_PEP_ID=MMETSP1468-20131203/15286_1 /TAXON_ID=1461545 /ORGANISM="Mantoniella sp, Strain CCMP1436" /LENGTH=103 /DNA_ID=CAMNT_0044433043 /DNA_START=324 /DNA_END=636 /DNA_ORIENTATION=+